MTSTPSPFSPEARELSARRYLALRAEAEALEARIGRERLRPFARAAARAFRAVARNHAGALRVLSTPQQHQRLLGLLQLAIEVELRQDPDVLHALTEDELQAGLSLLSKQLPGFLETWPGQTGSTGRRQRDGAPLDAPRRP